VTKPYNGDVAVLAWPQQAAEFERLRPLRVPRLLLVPAGVDPPGDTDYLVDWVRVPASAQDIAARVVALMRRAEGASTDVAETPSVDRHGRCVYRERWTALSPTEARLARVLCERFNEVVPEEELLRHGWQLADTRVEPPKANALRVHLTRLRQRIGELGLEVISIRNQGVVLQPRAVDMPGASVR
jgi:DNA-binding response OmpR family regulator